jgi:2-dehydropantoate 2-reductase
MAPLTAPSAALGAPAALRSTPIERGLAFGALPPDTRSSLLIDLQQGKPTEVEALQGEVVRRGRALGVPTPGMTALYAVLRAATAHGS